MNNYEQVYVQPITKNKLQVSPPHPSSVALSSSVRDDWGGEYWVPGHWGEATVLPNPPVSVQQFRSVQ